MKRNSRFQGPLWWDKKSFRWPPRVAWVRGDEKASLCTVVETWETSHPGSPSSEADQTRGGPLARASSLACRTRSHRKKGVWELRMAGCASAAGPGPTPHPRPCRDPAPVAWAPGDHYGGAALSTSEGDGNGCASQRLSGEGEVGADTPHLKCAPLPEKTSGDKDHDSFRGDRLNGPGRRPRESQGSLSPL